MIFMKYKINGSDYFMKVKFKNLETFIYLTSYCLYRDKVSMAGDGIEENLNGFILYEDDEETVIRDCSDYKYKWNIYTEYENGIVLTESRTNREMKPVDNEEDLQEIINPFSNEELTEAVAGLMYELSMIQLGLEV